MALGFTGIVQNIFTSPRFKKRKFDPELLDVNDIILPIYYKDIDMTRILRDIKSELHTFKSLGYRFRKLNELEKNEYHSMQIGILLKALHLGADLKVLRVEDYFPEFIYSMNYTLVQGKISDIIKKYDISVSKVSTEINLNNDYIWNPLEAGYLLFYLSFYKNTLSE